MFAFGGGPVAEILGQNRRFFFLFFYAVATFEGFDIQTGLTAFPSASVKVAVTM